MKRTVKDDDYGIITFFESNVTNKREITINGKVCQKINRKQYLLEKDGRGIAVRVDGSLWFTGITLNIGEKEVVIYERFEWYERLVILLSLIIPILWGNFPPLVAILPIMGGLIGGLITGFFGVIIVLVFRYVNKPLLNVLLGIFIMIGGMLINFLLTVIVLAALLV